jgi:hypothetical protein
MPEVTTKRIWLALVRHKGFYPFVISIPHCCGCVDDEDVASRDLWEARFEDMWLVAAPGKQTPELLAIWPATLDMASTLIENEDGSILRLGVFGHAHFY